MLEKEDFKTSDMQPRTYFIRCVLLWCIVCLNFIKLRWNSDFTINLKKKVAEKRQNVQVAIPQKLEPIEQNEGDIRIQHNKVVPNLLTKLRNQKKKRFFLLLCVINQFYQVDLSI